MKPLLLLLLAILSATAQADPYIGYSDYQILTDPNFDAASYFAEMKKSGVNLQRIWATGYGNTASQFEEVMPFAKHGHKYDLTRLDAQYLRRLHEVFDAAGANGQRVLFTLFDRWQMGNAQRFIQTPWYYKNNTTNRILKNASPDFYDVERAGWRSIQENYVRRLVRETKQYRPIYEIMNEAKLPGDCEMLTAWHAKVATWIRDEDPDSEIAVNTLDRCQPLMELPQADWISLHYDSWNGGICDAVKELQPAGKKILIDTDGAFVDRVDNSRVQKWLQETLECNASFNHKDDIYRLDTDVLNIFRDSVSLR